MCKPALVPMYRETFGSAWQAYTSLSSGVANASLRDGFLSAWVSEEGVENPTHGIKGLLVVVQKTL